MVYLINHSQFLVFAGTNIGWVFVAKNGRYPQGVGLKRVVMQAGSGFVDKKTVWIDWVSD
jgi:hypothetical protein